MLYALLTLSGIGLISSFLLGVAAKKFGIKVDPRVEQIENVLPGANCGACGYAGCTALAKAIHEGSASVDSCIPGGLEVAQVIANIIGVKASAKERQVAKIFCSGGVDKAKSKARYVGILDCKGASLLGGVNKECLYACLGYGSCVKVCPFDAIKMGPQGIPIILEDKCKACGKCVAICPKSIIKLVPAKNHVFITCSSQDKAPIVKKLCTLGCIGCGICQKVCPEGAITVENYLAHIDYDKCTACLKCVEKCPRKIINYQEMIK